MSKDWLKGRGQISIPKPAKAGVNSDKGTVKGGAGQPLKMAGKGPVKGTMKNMGDAKKCGKYTWTGTNNTKWYDKWHTRVENMLLLFLIEVDYNFHIQKWFKNGQAHGCIQVSMNLRLLN